MITNDFILFYSQNELFIKLVSKTENNIECLTFVYV